MRANRRTEKLFDWSWLLVWGLLSSLWCVTAAAQLSATFDEPVYIARGLQGWRTGTPRELLLAGTMPLPIDVATLPLYVWEQCRGVPFDTSTDIDLLLPWARAAALVFWWLLLFYGRLVGRQLAGRWGGRLAVALLACEPNFLAHAALATTDIAVSACLLALLYHFRIGRDGRWFRRVGIPAFWFAAAVLAKASGLVFGVICLLVVELERWYQNRASLFRQRRWVGAWRPALRDLMQIGWLGLALTFIYCGSDWQVSPSFVKWAQGLPEGMAKPGLVWFAEHLRIFANAGHGIARQVVHNIKGHGAFLLGQWWPHAVWYYFPVLLTIKLTVPLLLIPAVLAVLRPRALWNWACLAAAALFLFSLNCRVQIGIRLMLPLLALASVGLAAGVVQAITVSAAGWRRRLLTGSVGAGVGWMAMATLAVWPQGLCYINELWGGPLAGNTLVSDSNYDWGQGLTELTDWQHRQGLASLDVWYFGKDPTINKLPLREMTTIFKHCRGVPEAMASVHGRYLAVSTTVLAASPSLEPALQRAADYLLTRRVLDRTTTFLIYDVAHAADETPAEGPGGLQVSER